MLNPIHVLLIIVSLVIAFISWHYKRQAATAERAVICEGEYKAIRGQ